MSFGFGFRFFCMILIIILLAEIMQKQSQNKGQSNIISQEAQSSSYLIKFKEHMLKAWLPIPTLNKTIALFFTLSLIFIAIGIPMIILSNQIIEVRFRYDDLCQINSKCNITFEVPKAMEAPIFVYYQLNDYYQNHRLYASSVSQQQLRGDLLSLSEISTICQPITTNSDLYRTTSIDQTPLIPSEPANPCGIIAYSIFNDTFSIFYPNRTNISTMTTDGIAWPSDVARYKSNPSVQWLNLSDPRVMNWMRIASLPDFRKLWARINNNIPSGQYILQVNNIYDISQFGSSKYFILSTSNFFGSKNQFISIMYICIGSICFLIGVIFIIRMLKGKRNKKGKQ